MSDETIWNRLREVGFDEESIKRRDRSSLIAHVAKLETEISSLQNQIGILIIEKKEWVANYEQMRSNANTFELAWKRDYATHVVALAEAKKSEEGLKKALRIEKERLLDGQALLTRGLEEYVGKSVDWKPRGIKLKQNKGDSNQDYEKIYARALTLWKDRKPVEEFIRKSLKLDDSQPLSSHSYRHSPQSQHSPILSSPINSQSLSSHSYQHSPQSQRSPDTATVFSSPINSQPQLSHNSVTATTFSFPISSPQS
ncbi:protein crowded nuclei 4, partial [Tanacetum coccineum]